MQNVEDDEEDDDEDDDEDRDDSISRPRSTKVDNRSREQGSSSGERYVNASVGSPGKLDISREDFNRDTQSRATGFLGKSSEVTWLSRLKKQVRFNEDSGGRFEQERDRHQDTTMLPDPRHEFSTSRVDYNTNDQSVIMTEDVDAFALPNMDVADNLLNTYMNSVHCTYPIVGKNTFVNQYRTFFRGPPIKPGSKWMAVLNLVFAIAAKHSHLTRAPWAGDASDHLVYFERARLLGLTAERLMDHSDMQQVQVYGLTAFYFLCIDQMNR